MTEKDINPKELEEKMIVCSFCNHNVQMAAFPLHQYLCKKSKDLNSSSTPSKKSAKKES